MKRVSLLATALCLLLVGCGVQKQPEPPIAPLHLETLTVEFAAVNGEGTALLGALHRFPEKLRSALSENGVEVDQVQITLGTSQDATARAVGQGGVDVAFLTPEGYLVSRSGGTVQLTDPGQTALLCVGPSEYGRALAGRKTPTWDELNHARWGVLSAESDLGHRYLNLWLADGYEGRTLTDLTQVREYESYEALLRGAAAEEIDLFPTTEGFLDEVSDAWVMDATRTDEAGYRGFHREAALSAEVTAIGKTAPRHTLVAVVREDEILAGEGFQTALEQALNILSQDEDRSALAGTEDFVPVTAETLDPLRRLLTLEG